MHCSFYVGTCRAYISLFPRSDITKLMCCPHKNGNFCETRRVATQTVRINYLIGQLIH